MLVFSLFRSEVVLTRRAAVFTPLVGILAHPQKSEASVTQQGMQAFSEGKVEESIERYDSVIEANPQLKPYLWQRGLSLYYADRFAEGAEQFAADVAVNPNDTEEQIWHLLCLARLYGGLEKARPFKLTVGTDQRKVMRQVQALFLSGSIKDEAALAETAKEGDAFSKFYAALYLSLYYESLADKDKAEARMREAVATEYAQGRGRADPMVVLARVAVERRGWADSGIYRR